MTKAKSKSKQGKGYRHRDPARAENDARIKAHFKTPKPRKPAFTKVNLHMPVGFSAELRGALKDITITEVSMLAEILKVERQQLMTHAGIEMDIEDIEAYEGGIKKAADSGEYWFHAGPALVRGEDKNAYILMQGSVLNWLLDSIMFRISYDGLKVLKDLGLVL